MSKYFKHRALCAGLVFIAALAAFIVLFVTRPSARLEKITAVITDVELSPGADVGEVDAAAYTYYVDYKYGSVEYQHIELEYSEPDFEVGKEIEIYCDPDDPTKIKSDPRTMMIYTAVIAAAALVIFVYKLISSNNK